MCAFRVFQFHKQTPDVNTVISFSVFLWKWLKWILCSVHLASVYNLVNKTNLVHNLFLVYLSISVWYAGCTLHTRQSSTQNNKYPVPQKRSCVSWWWAHICPKHVEIDKYTKNKLCTKLVLFTRIKRTSLLVHNHWFIPYKGAGVLLVECSMFKGRFLAVNSHGRNVAPELQC